MLLYAVFPFVSPHAIVAQTKLKHFYKVRILPSKMRFFFLFSFYAEKRIVDKSKIVNIG